MTEEKEIAREEHSGLLDDLKALIEQGRAQVLVAVNSALTMTYWQVGRRINEAVLKGKRAEYGKKVVVLLAEDLVIQFGKSFEAKNLRRMMQFAEAFPDGEIVVPLARQLSWTHAEVARGIDRGERTPG